MDNYTVYGLIDNNSNIFYIGRTKNLKRRIYYHNREIKRGTKNYTYNKIRKMMQDGYILTYQILFDNLTYELSVSEEIRLIKEYRDSGVKLTNLTDGGEGTIGHKPVFTEDWKNKLKIARRNFFEAGGVVFNKGLKLEDLIGKDEAERQKKRIGNKISTGIKNGTIQHNKGKKLEDIVKNKDRALEIKQISSETAKKTFTGSKQSNEHIEKRSKQQRITKSKWTNEQKQNISIKAKIAANASIRRNYIKVDLPNGNTFIKYCSYKELEDYMRNELNLACGKTYISKIIRGLLDYNITKHKCNFSIVDPQLPQDTQYHTDLYHRQ